MNNNSESNRDTVNYAATWNQISGQCLDCTMTKLYIRTVPKYITGVVIYIDGFRIKIQCHAELYSEMRNERELKVVPLESARARTVTVWHVSDEQW